MVSFSSKRQSQFPRHHTSTARFPSKGYKKGDEEGERVGGGDNCEIMKRKDVNEEDVATVGQSKKQVKNASDDVSSQDDAGMEPEDVEKLSIQSQSEFQPLLRGMCTAPVCISAEDKKDIHDESGRLVAVSKAEVECLLLSSKQAAYGNGEKRTPQEKTVSLNVHEEVEVGSCLYYYYSFSINRIHMIDVSIYCVHRPPRLVLGCHQQQPTIPIDTNGYPHAEEEQKKITRFQKKPPCLRTVTLLWQMKATTNHLLNVLKIYKVWCSLQMEQKRKFGSVEK